MAGFIPEITTRITVNVDLSELDEAIGIVQSSEVLFDIGSLVDELESKKERITELKEPLGEAVAKGLQSNQEMIISSKHYITGLMANSVDISSDGDDFLVGNTAMSVYGFPYPLAIETGSHPHWVEPVTYDALHWVDSTGEHFSKGHVVGGIDPDPFVEPSIDDTMYDIDVIVDELLEDL